MTVNNKKVLDLFSLQDSIAIVTGGAGRLGFQHVQILHDAGARVISFDVIKNTDLKDIADQIVVDITDRNKVIRAVNTVVKKYGHIDILINNAALNPRVGKDQGAREEQQWAPHEEYSEELWRSEFDVGLHGAFFCTQAVARHMIKQNKGVVLNIASTSAITAPDHRKYKPGRFKSPAYPVVKTALLGLTRSWASYFSRVAPRVRVNAVCFGAVNFGLLEPEFLAKRGERNMLGRPAQPEDYQGVVLFLCSQASVFLTVSTVIMDGGQTAW